LPEIVERKNFSYVSKEAGMKDWIHGINWWLLALAVAIWWGGRRFADKAARRAAERRKTRQQGGEIPSDKKAAPGKGEKIGFIKR
jgi:hypothetical protein